MSTTTTIAEVAKPQRGYASITANLAGTMISVPLSVVGVRRPNLSEDGATRLVCPGEHDHAVRVTQTYNCSENDEHGPFAIGECARARETDDGKLVKLGADELDAARFDGVEKGELDLAPYPADEVLADTRPGKLQYRLRPPTKAKPRQRELYAALMAAVSDESHVWVGRCRIRDSFAIYRLEVWRGQLCMTELIHPDDLAPCDDLSDLVVDERTAEVAGQLAANLAQDWDPAIFTNDVKARIDKLAERTAAGDDEVLAPAAEAPAAPALDIVALMEASIKAAPKAKVPAGASA